MIGRGVPGLLPAVTGFLAALFAAVPGGGVSAETRAPASQSDGKPPASWRSLSSQAPPDTAGRPVVLRRGWLVMGTLLELTAVAPETARARAALSASRVDVFRLDSLLNTYRPESELARLNAAAGTGQWTDLSPATATALPEALRWVDRTGGAVTPPWAR